MVRRTARGGRSGSWPLLAVLLLLAVPPAQAEPRAYLVDPARSQVRFLAYSRMTNASGAFGRFEGEIRIDTAQPQTAEGRVIVDVTSLYTGNVMRDWHLRGRDFFDVTRFPTATFVTTAIQPQGDHFVVTGDLTIKGMTKPITMPVAVSHSEDTIRILGEIILNRWAFGINYQSWMLPVADEARLFIDLTWIPKR